MILFLGIDINLIFLVYLLEIQRIFSISFTIFFESQVFTFLEKKSVKIARKKLKFEERNLKLGLV